MNRLFNFYSRHRQIRSNIPSIIGLTIALLMFSGAVLAAPPPNDNFANAQQLTGTASQSATNQDATHESGEPIHGGTSFGTGDPSNDSVWYKYVALATGVYTFTTMSSGDVNDTMISAYSGSAVNALTPLAHSNNYPGLVGFSRVSFGVSAGQTYYIAVDAGAASQGSFGIVYSFSLTPTNNNFASSVDLGSSYFVQWREPVTGSTVNATSETGEPNHSGSGGFENNSIWYRWTPTESKSVTFSTAGSAIDTVLAVYTGSSVSGLTLVGKNDDFGPSGTFSSQVTFAATAGVTYHLAIDGYQDSTGNTRLAHWQNTQENRDRFNFGLAGTVTPSVFRPSNGQWWLDTNSGPYLKASFGLSTDKPTPADFTGDGKVDIAVWRPSNGVWYILRSEDDSLMTVAFGTNGDIPAPGQFSNDTAADPAVFRPSTGTWYIRRTNGAPTVLVQQFGTAGDVPVAADYDGDGKSELAIFRPSNGQWWINRTSAGLIVHTFGANGDKPVVGDYTGDGRSDVAIWRPSNGTWFILRSEDSSYYAFQFGLPDDIPAPADYDGDFRFDGTVFRPSTGTWYVNGSASGTDSIQFGLAGDRPVASAYIP